MATARYQPRYTPQQTDTRLLRMATFDPMVNVMKRVEGFGERAGAMVGAAEGERAVLAGEQPEQALPLSPAAIAFNRAIDEGYSTQVESSIRAKIADLGSRFNGRNPTDPESFGEMFDASSDEILQAVPSHLRARVGLELQTRRQMAVSEITERARAHALKLQIATIEDGLKVDASEAGLLARDGANDEAVGLVMARANERIENMVADGVWSEEQGQMYLQEFEGSVAAERLFGTAVRRGTLEALYQNIVRGGDASDGLSMQQRDALASKVSAEIGRQNARAAHARSMQRAAITENNAVARAIIYQRTFGMEPTGQLSAAEQEISKGTMPVDPDVLLELNRRRGMNHVAADIISEDIEAGQLKAAEYMAAAARGEVDPAVAMEAVKTANKYRDGLTGDDPTGFLAEIGQLADAPDGIGVVPPSPVVFDSPDDFAASLQQRRRILNAQEDRTNLELPSMTKAEFALFSNYLDQASHTDRIAALSIVSQVDGERAGLIFDRLDKAGRRHHAIVGRAAAAGLEAVARDIDMAPLLDKTAVKIARNDENSGRGILETFNEEAAGLWQLNTREGVELASIHREATDALYNRRATLAGVSGFDERMYREAAKDSVGGIETVQTGTGWFGGAQSRLLKAGPRPWPEVIEALSGADLAQMGGIAGADTPEKLDIIANAIRQTGRFRQTKRGVQVIAEVGGQVMTLQAQNGGVFILDPRKLD